ncbi:MAG: RdgB/HAM1 family non-canonical purine NTP pyrophosphatase [Rickettsiales bacterium]|jgi:XTP/dITP diphosphohydrolase|nr:RdgB/HAM1 family non-canonical purine NTP pyrophosphatase [Rickettsiales bacterium]
MKKKILIVTGNPGKLRDFREILKNFNVCEVISLSDIENNLKEPEENGRSFAENSTLKAEYYGKKLNMSAIADDSGLCIKAFGGAPGIYSKRYSEQNGGYPAVFDVIEKRFIESKITDYSSSFVCNIAFYDNDGKKTHNFEGICEGKLVFPARGTNGFGYCSIFTANGMDKTFGEISNEERNRINHRFLASQKLIEFLENK